MPSAHAVRRDGPIVLDAKLDEAAWAQAKPITEFKQVDPDEGKPASQRTEVRFLYDDDALYVGAKMYDTGGAAGVTTRLVRRDATFDSDYLELVIDGYHDHLGRAFFDLNPSGSKGDY
ncbi:MAG TPA: sugar-binding protein, partial [Gemmatimonadaceae bacterium]